MALKLAGEQIGIQEKIETILKMNKELNARSTRGGERERAVQSQAEGVEE